MTRTLVATVVLLAPNVGLADVLDVQHVTDDVWAIVGPTEQRNPENLANNATFGLVVTPEGAVLMDPGGSWQGAEMLHEAIRTVADQPVRYVIDTGGQDHRWLGNGYWQAQGATVIASQAAVEDHRARAEEHLIALSQFLGDELDGTEPAYADVTFETDYTLEFGGFSFEIMHRGAAHTPGDSFVWLPADGVVVTGDIVYFGRVLGVKDHSDSKSWLKAFAAVEALDPVHVVPGHGPPTTMDRARADTRDYLAYLYGRVSVPILKRAGRSTVQFRSISLPSPTSTCSRP